MFNKLSNISPVTAYRINLGIYAFHVLVGIITFFYVKFSVGLNSYQMSWSSALALLITPPYAVEFYFYVLMLFLVWKKDRLAKSLIKANMVVILIFILLGTFIGYSMQLSYFLFFWGGILSFTKMYSSMYFVVMAAIWFFYLMNLLFWVKKIEWKKDAVEGIL